MEMTLLVSGVDSTTDFLNKAYFPPFMIRIPGDDGFCTKPLLPKHLDALFIVKDNFPIGVENNFKQ